MAPVLVTGGTGTLGREVVACLTARSVDTRVLSRRRRTSADPAGTEWAVGDLVTGRGLREALTGADAVVHCATDGRRPSHDLAATRQLLDVARKAGTGHLVYVSIVGVDRVPLPYYRTKLQVEELIAASGLPWSVLRATRFHQLIAAVTRVLSRLPVLPMLAATSFQPVDPAEVAARLADLALAAPAGRAPDLGGPQIRPAADLARAWLEARGVRRTVVEVRIPGATSRGYREGGHLAPRHRDGTVTFEQFLARS